MKNIIRSLFIIVCLAGCNQAQRDESPDAKTKVTELKSSTPEEINGMSIYQLPSIWKTQAGDEITFEDLKGDVLVVVMIYTSCQSACPRLVADMKGIESKVSERVSSGVRYVLVSIDPEHDTPERLEQFSIEKEMTDPQWLFLQGTKETVREFANIVAVRYKSISPMEFSHSNIISVFDREGVMQHQQEGLAIDYQDTVNAVLELADQSRAQL